MMWSWQIENKYFYNILNVADYMLNIYHTENDDSKSIGRDCENTIFKVGGHSIKGDLQLPVPRGSLK